VAAGLLLAAPLAAAVAPHSQTAASSSVQQMDHISVQVLGTSGPPVILIPGLSSPRGAWSGVAPALAQGQQACRGYSRSCNSAGCLPCLD
jgi:pimeloyl-ACP methyl ester carboxylesterase